MKKMIQYVPKNKTIYILPHHMIPVSSSNFCPYKKNIVCEAAECKIELKNGKGINFHFLCRNKGTKCELLSSFNTIIGEFEE